MRVNRILRRYGSEIKLVGTIIVICLLFGIYNLIESYATKKVEGTTLSSSIHNETQSQIAPTYTPYPTLLVPTTVQINIYINSTNPIYNEYTTNTVLQTLSLYPTQTITSQPSNPTITIIPTINPTSVPTSTPTPTTIPLVSSFTGKYFNNINISGTAVFLRTDNIINFEWNAGSPDSKISVDNFSILWEGNLNTQNGSYQITLNHDDGMKIFIDNNLVHNHWVNKPAAWEVFTVNLTEGPHTIRIEYYEYLNGATAQFDIKKL